MKRMDRKKLRLNGFDYSTNGAYFVTLCTINRKCILSSIRKSGNYSYPEVKLTDIGLIVKKYMNNIPGITYYVIMPNHIHLIVEKENILNSVLSTQPSKNHVFSRLFACVILKSYVFSLVFSLMSENKGNFLLFAADYLIQQPCGSTLRFPCSVSVDIHCGTDISVSEKLLHILWCCSI